jgi:hypothetical protein
VQPTLLTAGNRVSGGGLQVAYRRIFCSTLAIQSRRSEFILRAPGKFEWTPPAERFHAGLELMHYSLYFWRTIKAKQSAAPPSKQLTVEKAVQNARDGGGGTDTCGASEIATRATN